MTTQDFARAIRALPSTAASARFVPTGVLAWCTDNWYAWTGCPVGVTCEPIADIRGIGAALSTFPKGTELTVESTGDSITFRAGASFRCTVTKMDRLQGDQWEYTPLPPAPDGSWVGRWNQSDESIDWFREKPEEDKPKRQKRERVQLHKWTKERVWACVMAGERIPYEVSEIYRVESADKWPLDKWIEAGGDPDIHRKVAQDGLKRTTERSEWDHDRHVPEVCMLAYPDILARLEEANVQARIAYYTREFEKRNHWANADYGEGLVAIGKKELAELHKAYREEFGEDYPTEEREAA